MNTFVKPVQKIEFDYKHEDPPLFLDADLMIVEILNFIEDSQKEDESECQGWGVEELVFPLECWDKFFELRKSHRLFKKAQDKGWVHVVNIQEIENGDNVNSVTLSMGYMNLNQKIVFYDLPQSQKLAA